MSERKSPSFGLRFLQIIILIAAALVTFGALILPIGLRPSDLQLEVGQVAPYDLQAPTDTEYVSEVRTEEARLAAESAVPPFFTPPDPAIARQQIERLNTVLQVISSIRDDQLIPFEEKKTSLATLSDVRLDEKSIDYLLAISPTRWESTQEETLRVLEQVMRRSVHEDAVEATQASVPNLVSLTLNEQQSELVAELASAFIIPNSFYSDELTQVAKQSARASVEPVVQSYKAGETIVPGGEIITPADMEALSQLNLIRPGQRLEDTIGAAALTILSTIFVPLYFVRRQRSTIISEGRNLMVIAFIFLIFLVGARLITNRTLAPYAYPLQAAGLLIATLFGIDAGIVISIPLSLLAAYGLPNTFDLTPYYLLTSIIGILVLGSARRFWGYARAGMGIILSGFVVILSYRFPVLPTDWLGVVQLAGAVVFSGFASASTALLLQYLLAQTLGLTTALQLLDISRPDSPLLQFFLRHAPGTYQHSLQVANLAEQAAEKISADQLLTRVGAQFHDIGKALNPTFFIENQLPENVDKHHDMLPEEAAAIIIRHVPEGVQLGRKYRLPRRLEDFMLEHHGTLITRYQYSQAVEAAGGDASKVDIEKFRYPGPTPRSRETALLMLADAVEARARAERPDSDEGLRALVRNVIDTVQKNNQLDDTTLTLRDLSIITESFVTTLRGQYHPRIQYPKPAEEEERKTVPNK